MGNVGKIHQQSMTALRLAFCLILRPDHVMGMDGSMGPPGSQNNLGPSNSEGSMYSPSRYPSQQRSALVSAPARMCTESQK